jgi:diacylglycerol kinase (ATP)
LFLGFHQFLNKVLYAREGAKSIIDRAFVDLPWQVRLEVDGTEIEIPEVVSESVNCDYYL